MNFILNIENLKIEKSPMKYRSGFSLVEILVVVAVVGLIAVTATSVFFTVSQSQENTSVREEIKKDGNFALTTMSKMIRQAVYIECINPAHIEVTNPNGNITSFICYDDSGIASQSADHREIMIIDSTVNKYTIDCDYESRSFVSCANPNQISLDFRLEYSGRDPVSINFNTSINPRSLR